jgi:hypothetical protein
MDQRRLVANGSYAVFFQWEKRQRLLLLNAFHGDTFTTMAASHSFIQTFEECL